MHFVHDIISCINIFMQCIVCAMEGIGKTSQCESAGYGHLFTICTRFTDGTQKSDGADRVVRPYKTGRRDAVPYERVNGSVLPLTNPAGWV